MTEKERGTERLLEAAAKAVGLSPSYLSRLFSAIMKMTLKQYADKLIMERAMEMARTATWLSIRS